MLPAMNVDDASGARRHAGRAPPEVFIVVMALAASVLTPADHATLAARLGA